MALTSTQQAAIKKQKDAYAQARASNDYSGMRAANEAANKIRQSAGVATYDSSKGDSQYAAKRNINTGSTVVPTSTAGKSSGGGGGYQKPTVDPTGTGSYNSLDEFYQANASRINGIAAKNGVNIDTARAMFKANLEGIGNYAGAGVANMSELTKAYRSALNAGQGNTPSGGPVTSDEVTRMITELMGGDVQQMSWKDAQAQASRQLDPQYADAAIKLKQGLNADMEQRGIYNSPLASGIMTDSLGRLGNEQVSAISELANTLQQNNNELSLQKYQSQLSSLGSLLNSLIGKESTEAELTGMYNGQQTVQSRQQQISSALDSVNTMGKVTTQEQANLLGVPVGTPSWQAAAQAQELQQDMQMFQSEMSLKKYSASISAKANNLAAEQQKFQYALQVWETTGKAPAGILQNYGVTAGTTWGSQETRSAQYQLDELNAQTQLISAEEENVTANRAQSFAKGFNMDMNSALYLVEAIDNSTDLSSAKNYINAIRSNAAAQGANITAINSALTRFYNTSSYK